MLVYEVVCVFGLENFSWVLRGYINFQSFDVKYLLLPWDACRYSHAGELEMIGGVWFSLLTDKLIFGS